MLPGIWQMPLNLTHSLRAQPMPDTSMKQGGCLDPEGCPCMLHHCHGGLAVPLPHSLQPTALLSVHPNLTQPELAVYPVNVMQAAGCAAGRSTSCRRSCRARQRRCCAATLQSPHRWTASQLRRRLATHLQARICANTAMSPDGDVLTLHQGDLAEPAQRGG